MKIALVEDDLKLSDLLSIVLKDVSPHITTFDNGWKALDGIIEGNFDLVILDIMLPGLNGVEVLKKIRTSGIKVPILMLTAKSEEDDKVLGLESGADDYITKPFSNKELVARCNALLRRSANQNSIDSEERKSIQIGNLKISAVDKMVYINNKPIDLTAKEFDLLYLFMENAGRNFTRLELLERVWGEHFEGLEHTVNSNINRLRMKIEEDAAKPNYILTVWGIGYRFNKNPN